ncbi:hypothetical protein [Methylorubrum suomiense]|uniref:Uncharacterized protein n=1 Tax=Methylorubrum suomiense TaxID=144191 RepID=A0ABQ4V2L8_9HYPH|nr:MULTISPECIES: hypothetical protein [Methylobacteriaceae]GJE77859.1 hypothetical protein BGCPKDLD_4467 [Methylorubrum suomiense]
MKRHANEQCRIGTVRVTLGSHDVTRTAFQNASAKARELSGQAVLTIVAPGQFACAATTATGIRA